MVRGRTDYTADAVAAARSVLLELTHLLGEYRNDVVVIGGWVPELLLSRPPLSQGERVAVVSSEEEFKGASRHEAQKPSRVSHPIDPQGDRGTKYVG